ncbi:MAG: hypothetical protein E7235_03095 [Lachnospiraceae bacterium]|nr:hypothetical protein [Lachnospiraceae bacterium]
MIARFFIYGIIGWCMEIIWTSILSGKKTLKGTTSLWMFPVYGSVVLMEPIFVLFGGWPVFIRGTVYMLCIFVAEYVTGLSFNAAGVCPWDYSHAKLNIQGVIRLDYAPLWFGAGLFYEWVFGLISTIL